MPQGAMTRINLLPARIQNKRERDKQYREQHRDTLRAKHRADYKADPAKWKNWARRWSKSNPETARESARRSQWRQQGIDPDRAAVLWADAKHCALCKSHTRRLQVDHDHHTGRIRGILCMKCNTALGTFGDSLDGIEQVARYLRGERVE